jgi:hypothetical protein
MLSGEAAALYTAPRTAGATTAAVAGAWAAARSASPAPFLVARFSPTEKDTLEVVSAGDGGLAGARASLAADGVFFGAFSFWAGALQRFAFFSFIGAAVSGVKRGRVALQRGAAARAFEGCAADVELSDGAGDAEVLAALRAALRGSGAPLALAPPG